MQNFIKAIFTLFVGFSLITIFGAVGLLLRIISFGALIPFNRKYFIAFSSKLTFSVLGMKLVLPKEKPDLSKSSLITFNHNSYLDVFALGALGYNVPMLLSEKTIRIIPITLCALAIGVIYIPQKKHAKRRLAFFKKLDKKVQSENLSIMASSEGVHDHFHGIGRFNRGVYHMATLCNMPVVPLFISLAEESNPFNKYRHFKRGVLKVELLPIIDTNTWVLGELENNKDAVRKVFVEKFNREHGTNHN